MWGCERSERKQLLSPHKTNHNPPPNYQTCRGGKRVERGRRQTRQNQRRQYAFTPKEGERKAHRPRARANDKSVTRLSPGDWRSNKRPVSRRHRRTRAHPRSGLGCPLFLEADRSLLPEGSVPLVQVYDRRLDLVAHRLRLLVRDILGCLLHLDRPAESAAQPKHRGKP